jgi:hypothetical protein
MSALACSLLRTRSAKNRLPRLTGRGKTGLCARTVTRAGKLVNKAHSKLLDLHIRLTHRAPLIAAIAFNILR